VSTWDAIALAARSVARRSGRVLLAVLAVALAAALLTALLTVAATTRSRVLGQITKGGPLAGITVDGPDLDRSAVRRIAGVPGVVSVLPVVSLQQAVLAPDPPVYGPSAAPLAAPFIEGVVGVDLARADRFPISVIAGRLPAPGSMTEVAVTEGYLERVGLDRSLAVRVLGTELELGTPRFPGARVAGGAFGRWTRSTVVGVVAQDAGPGDFLVPMQQAEAAWDFSSGGSDPRFAALMVEARTLANVSAVRERIGELGYATIASETLLTNVVRYVHVVEIVLSGIGLIALVIAALGIGNAMLAAVRERRREIGVLKAIGARDRDILRVFLMEAAFVGLIGGALGTLAGWGAAKAVGVAVNGYLASQGLAGARVIFPVTLVAGAVAGSTVLAVVAGAVPALRASRLPAVEAMEGP
jgi:ABC-type antimicrobial peptide transport system permease subunit